MTLTNKFIINDVRISNANGNYEEIALATIEDNVIRAKFKRTSGSRNSMDPRMPTRPRSITRASSPTAKSS